jgi:hypothetical protein
MLINLKLQPPHLNHKIIKGLVQFREENGEFALGELNRCYHFDD